MATMPTLSAPAPTTAPRNHIVTLCHDKEAGAQRQLRLLFLWSVAFVVAGVVWRLIRYFAQFPIWGDEAYLCLNFIEQTFAGLLREQKHCQAAPILFLWSELTAYHLLGASELAMRLLPFLAGVASVFVFWRLARLTLDPLSATLAVGLFAVSYYPVRHACEVKPYSCDMLMSLLLMALAAQWLMVSGQWSVARKRPSPPLGGGSDHSPLTTHHWLLITLCLLIVPALGLSNPVVFVAGGVSLALLPALWRRRDWKEWCLWGLYNVLMVGAFLVYFRINVGMQTADTQSYLVWYWREAFPPRQPLALVKWLVDIHTSNLMAYPIGGKNGASTLTCLLFLAGVVALWRTRRRSLLLLLLVPFTLTFVAAFLHRYPYGHSARVSQHLAPAVCLLATAGGGWLISALCRSWQQRKHCLAICGGLLLLLAGAGIVRDVFFPYKTQSDLQERHIIQEIADRTSEETPIVVLNAKDALFPETVWYLHYYHPAILFSSKIDWNRLQQEKDNIVCLYLCQKKAPDKNPPVPLQHSPRPWQLTERKLYSRPLEPSWGSTEYCLVLRWSCRKHSTNGI